MGRLRLEGELALPGGRPAGQTIKVTFAYDDNMMMRCSFVDVATGKKTEVDLSIQATELQILADVEKFTVE